MALVGASCASKPKSAFSTVPGQLAPADTHATTTLATLPSPLTGEAVAPGIAKRAVVIVKVDNSPQARPQAGLNAADVVYEERVEGSVVRFLSIFQTTEANLVGPVRSVRSTDAAVLAPLGGIFAFSGGIKPFIDKVEAAGVKTITEGDSASSPVFARPGKTRPYATYADTRKLRPLAGTTTPPPLFARLPDGTAFLDGNPTATPVTGLRVVFGSLTTADWTWDAGKRLWLRSTNNTPHVLQDGTRLSTRCLVQQTVGYRATTYTDRSGAGVDEAVVTGTGKALVACDGYAVQARWQKNSAKSVTTYTNAATGSPIKLPVGRVWVSLVPTNGTITLKTPLVGRATTTSTR
ncbi:MAG: hypothetical protein QOJ00_2747 [Actinomycetota bacterium]